MQKHNACKAEYDEVKVKLQRIREYCVQHVKLRKKRQSMYLTAQHIEEPWDPKFKLTLQEKASIKTKGSSCFCKRVRTNQSLEFGV